MNTRYKYFCIVNEVNRLRLKVQELAYIKEADININGITCIAGVNNTGKSTVGKVLFSLVYSLNQYQDLFEEERLISIQDRLRVVRLLTQNNYDEISTDLSHFLRNRDKTNFLDVLNNLKNKLIQDPQTLNSDKQKLLKVTDEIRMLLLKEADSIEIKQETLEKVILSTFENQLSPLHSYNNTTILSSAADTNKELLKLKFENNKIINFQLNQELPFNQAFYIESPYVFQFVNIYQMVTRSSLFRRSQFKHIPAYISDLLEKMINKHPTYDSVAEKILHNADDNYENLEESLSKLLDGEMLYDKKSNEFIFAADKIEQPIKMANVASGIKSLSIVHRLLQNGWLNDFSVLIIDEPENHLHPKWQIEFARFLVDLYCDLGVKVLITSHSPYFIEALDVFTKKRQIHNNTSFYHAEIQSNGTILKDVSDHLEVIFKLLSEPLEKLEEERL